MCSFSRLKTTSISFQIIRTPQAAHGLIEIMTLLIWMNALTLAGATEFAAIEAESLRKGA